ncbi:MAG: hypothetical protein H6819_12410 [Phycisphaerales bacterium]|nr:hypothetical protein [Phycisphaerales bacterium]MCB9855201.1 hypothetical protein [Phycisphaerales bacterium]MCB9862794.1 hypothetical protein [Phycisphaerales bacterium]
MISTLFYRIVQCVGWAALLAAHGVVLGTILAQSLAGPGEGVEILPSTARLHSLINSFAIAGGATLIALVISFPVGCAIAQGRRPWTRRTLSALMLVSILTMPSIHAYAWQLLMTSQLTVVRWLNDVMIATGPWGARGLSAVALGMWLWPIPAAAILDGLRRSGGEAMELALLDATPARALWRGAMPMLRGPIGAAAAVVFVSAALDALVAPLMLASDVWSVEMVREAELAMAQARPAGQIFWRSWPMLAAIALLSICAIPGLRRIKSWHLDASPSRDVRRFGGRSMTIVAGAMAGVAAMMPVIVFFAMLATDQRYTILSAMASVWQSAKGPASATAIVAAATCVLAIAIALACELAFLGRDSSAKFPGRLIVVVTIVTALLPASLVSTSLISFFASRAMGSASGWNLYDDTPVVWIAAMLARYAFIPVCLTVAAGWSAPRSVRDQAETDGASGIGAWRAGRWPFVRGAAIVGAGAAGLLAFSEVQASLLAKAPRWGDDSLAVYLDSQMHYGRHGQTLALALLMYLPIVVACAGLAFYGVMRGRGGGNARQPGVNS